MYFIKSRSSLRIFSKSSNVADSKKEVFIILSINGNFWPISGILARPESAFAFFLKSLKYLVFLVPQRFVSSIA